LQEIRAEREWKGYGIREASGADGEEEADRKTETGGSTEAGREGGGTKESQVSVRFPINAAAVNIWTCHMNSS